VRVVAPIHAVSGAGVVQRSATLAALPTPVSEPDSVDSNQAAPELRARDQAQVPARAQAPRALPAAQQSSLAATSLAVEVELLDRARAALSRKDPSAALHELDRYAQQAGERSLAREANLLRIEALRALGDAASAAEIAKRLVAEDPRGLTGQRARELMR
jgi:hypothetical protein